jgi:hypothetical protein
MDVQSSVHPDAVGVACLGINATASPPMRAAYVRTANVMFVLLDQNGVGLSLLLGANSWPRQLLPPAVSPCNRGLQSIMSECARMRLLRMLCPVPGARPV